MPITEAHVGRQYPPTAPYAVSAAKIAEFATAIGDDNPAYRGDEPIAPPTFVAMVAFPAWDLMFEDDDLGLALSRIVHGDQRFDYVRPLRAGDVITAELTIDKVRVRDTADFISSSTRILDANAELVCTAAATFIHSREAAA